MTSPYVPNTLIDAAEQIKAVVNKTTLDGQGDEYSFVAAREPAWHRKGEVVLGREMTVGEVIEKAHLGWTVSKSPLLATIDPPVITGDGVFTQVAVPNHFALTTTHAYTGEPLALGVTGNAREVVQIPELFQWGTDFVGGFGPDAAQLSSAGSWGKQRKVFASLKFAQGIMVGGKDPVDLYFTIKENMDGRGALAWSLSNVRGECRNTVTAGLRQAESRGTIRHTRDMRDRMAQIADIIGLSDEYTVALQGVYDDLLQREVDELTFIDMMEEVFGKRPDPDTAPAVSVTKWDNRLDAVQEERFGPVNTFEPRSGWGAINGLTSWLNYRTQASGESEAEKQDARAIAVMEGRTDEPVEKAMAFVLALPASRS